MTRPSNLSRHQSNGSEVRQSVGKTFYNIKCHIALEVFIVKDNKKGMVQQAIDATRKREDIKLAGRWNSISRCSDSLMISRMRMEEGRVSRHPGDFSFSLR